MVDALAVDNLFHAYGERVALDRLNLSVAPGEIFGILGPNGSGKSTLFRLVSTLVPVQQGSISVFGEDVTLRQSSVRSLLGVVFQSPSLDGKLTVLENLQCQAALYGMVQNRGKGRIDHVMKTLGIEERKNEMCEKLSGGLKRRVELAKGMLHRPKLFLMDEPTTGLDPAARIDFWHAIESLRTEQGMTVVFTTHLLEEAEKCDRIAILHLGNKVALDRPDALRRSAGEGVLTITTNHPEAVMEKLKESFSLEPVLVQSQIRVSTPDAARWVAPIAESLGTLIDQIAVGRPSLEDVFVAKTGHQFWDQRA